MMMQKDEPDDYVVATGVTNTAASPAWHPYSRRHHHHPRQSSHALSLAHLSLLR